MIKNRRRQAGAAMFVAVLMLVLMGALGIAALEGATQDRQIAGFQNRSNNAFYAAEAGVARAREVVRNATDRGDPVALPVTNLGDVALYDREIALPQFGPDPVFAATNPTGIRNLNKDGPAPGMEMGMGSVMIMNSLWQINVQGTSPHAAAGLNGRGSTARIETIEAKTMAGGGY